MPYQMAEPIKRYNKAFTVIDINSVTGSKLSSLAAGKAINELGQRTSINF